MGAQMGAQSDDRSRALHSGEPPNSRWRRATTSAIIRLIVLLTPAPGTARDGPTGPAGVFGPPLELESTPVRERLLSHSSANAYTFNWVIRPRIV